MMSWFVVVGPRKAEWLEELEFKSKKLTEQIIKC